MSGVHDVVPPPSGDDPGDFVAIRGGAEGLLGGERPVIGRVERRSWVGQTTMRVTLAVGGKVHTGTASAPSTPDDLRVTAVATLNALAEVIECDEVFETRGGAIIDLDGDLVVCVKVRRTDGVVRDLLGAVPLRGDDVRLAAARAALDAVDRQL